MATFRDDGLELNVKADISDFSTPTGDRFTIFAVNAVSPSGRYYKQETGQQLWMVDSSGGMHEISNEWLEARVEATSAKLDYIYPAVTQFMSAGLLFLNSAVVQTICSDLAIIGDATISGAISFVKGSVETSEECPTYINGGISAFSDFKAYEHFDFNKMGTIDTLDNITPFFVRSSANRLQPEGWSDPALLVIGNTRIYDMFKPTDRGLRFTVLNRENLQVIHDEVYDTAGSQYRVTDLAWKMFELMNNTKRVGILNSREDWESLIWRKQTVESVGMSASDLSPNYANLKVGSLLDQFDRFGLLKAIRAAGKHAEMHPSAAGSQYCAIFEGSNIYVDTSGASAIVYGTNRAVESWIPRVDPRLPVGGEQQRAQLAGWFMQPRQLDPTNNIADRSAAFVAFPYGRENDAVRETVYVNKDGGPSEFNARVSNLNADVLQTTFSSLSGVWHLIGDARIEADIVDITGKATTLVADTLDITASTRHVGQINMTDYKIVNLGYADIDSPQDAVNVEFTRIVTPIGAALDFGGNVAPSNWLMCQGAATTISGFDKLFNVIGFNFGMMSIIDISGSPTVVTGRTYTSISGVPMLVTDTNIVYGISAQLMTGIIQPILGGYQFVSGVVENVSGIPTFVTGSPSDVTGAINHYLLPLANGKTSIGAGQATVLDISGGSILYTYTIGELGGSDKHTLVSDELPPHQHTFPQRDDIDGSAGGNTASTGGGGSLSTGTTYVGGGLGYPHSIMQPYIVFNKIIRYK